jgi:ribonuclease E
VPFSSGEAGTPAVAPAFQPPLVIFQPPEVTAEPASRPAADEAAPGGQSAARQASGPASGDDEAADGPDGDNDARPAATRRRRRGGRGRGKGRPGAAGSPDGDAGPDAEAGPDAGRLAGGPGAGDDAAGAEGRDADAGEPAGTPDTAEGQPAARRRRRRRRGGSDGETAVPESDDPPNTVVHVRPARSEGGAADVRSVRGSTRLEAKRQRRREGRDSGRRRPPVITESEFLARRESVERIMVVRQHGDRTQIAVLEDGVLVEHYVDTAAHQSYVGNVYLGRVQNVLPSMEAAFVDIGKGRNAVLYAGEVNFDASGLEGESKRIESALRSGQSVLVQVTKDPIGHKGARLTSQVSLPGRYLVYVPGASMTGISRKLPDTERTRLKQILKEVMPENAGVIVRTAAEGASEEELARDVARLAAQWEAIQKKAKSATAPELLYSEPDLTIRVVRDIFNEDFSKLVIAGESDWDLLDEYVKYVAPHLAGRLERWEAADHDRDVFAAYRIDEQIAKALERKVWLPSGGSLVIDTTEAMVVIDVNTGKFTGQGGNLEETVTRNNLEAAEEIVRQLRLRDVGGIIVIDFIDMVLESNRELVLRRLLECLARDRTKHQVAEVTSLGLVQMTRKRVGSGLLEAFSVPCEHCNGRGVLISMEPVEPAPARDRGGAADGRAGRGRGKSAAARRQAAEQAAAAEAGKAVGPDGAVAAREGAGPDGAGTGGEGATPGGGDIPQDGPALEGTSPDKTSQAGAAPDGQGPSGAGHRRRRKQAAAVASAGAADVASSPSAAAADPTQPSV